MKNLFTILSILFLFSSCGVKRGPDLLENTDQHKNRELAPFYHGVASGDPDHESVIIWTRVTPPTTLHEIEVHWEISVEDNFDIVVEQGTFSTNDDRDYTVKVLVEGLQAGLTYFYRFHALDHISPVGRTKTAATNAEQLRFAVASCSNYEWGYFNAYRAMAEETDLDAILHLGDYIYEYEVGRYGDTTLGRLNIPATEIISLQDYRDRYALYRLDEDLQAAHQNHPFIAIWDDHEIANNSYKDGAQNHQDEEGSYASRRETARRVYYEWLPVRPQAHLYRSFSFGNLADLFMLDERLAGRSQQAESMQDPRLADASRSMLGPEQLSWFENRLVQSKAIWKLIGNQVIYSQINRGPPNFTRNLDAWDGYPSEQKKVADIILAHRIENVIFLTGDTHSSWAFEVTHDPHGNYQTEGGFAFEFGATSINSANSDESNHVDSVIAREAHYRNPTYNPHLKYTNMRDHGYISLTLTQEQLQADFIYVQTVKEKNAKSFVGKSFRVVSGASKLQEVH